MDVEALRHWTRLLAKTSTVDRRPAIFMTNQPSMALSNSERQRRYRNRHLGLGGRHERVSCLVFISTKRSIERLAFHFDCSITAMIEQLIKEKTAEILSKLDEDEQSRFLVQEALTEDAQV
jgi:hypothetical protein